MLLVVDVGNTQSVVGVYKRFTLSEAKKAKPLAKWRFSTQKSNAIDDIIATILPHFNRAGINPRDISTAACSCVVPNLDKVWEGVVRELCECDTLMCNADVATAAGLFVADYPTPAEIGADRVADAIAARALFGIPCVVVDFGTATNMEVVDARGAFVGGVITPGIVAGAGALFDAASRLGAVEMSAPARTIGKSSAEAIKSGIIFGEAARVDGLLARILNELCEGEGEDEGEGGDGYWDEGNPNRYGDVYFARSASRTDGDELFARSANSPSPSSQQPEAPGTDYFASTALRQKSSSPGSDSNEDKPFIVATGGLAETVVPYCTLVDTVEPDLTLLGLCLLADAYAHATPTPGAGATLD